MRNVQVPRNYLVRYREKSGTAPARLIFIESASLDGSDWMIEGDVAGLVYRIISEGTDESLNVSQRKLVSKIIGELIAARVIKGTPRKGSGSFKLLKRFDPSVLLDDIAPLTVFGPCSGGDNVGPYPDGGDCIMSPSDENLKYDVTPLDDSLERILRLSGVRYSWSEPEFDGQPKLGLLAQALEKEFPEVVAKNPANGHKYIAYGHLVAPLIEALKILTGRIRSLEEVVAALEKKNEK